MKHLLERQTWEAGPTVFSTSMENLPNGNESPGPWPCPSLTVRSWNATDHRLQGRPYLPATISGCPSDADQSQVLWQILTGESFQISANCITHSYHLVLSLDSFRSKNRTYKGTSPLTNGQTTQRLLFIRKAVRTDHTDTPGLSFHLSTTQGSLSIYTVHSSCFSSALTSALLKVFLCLTDVHTSP